MKIFSRILLQFFFIFAQNIDCGRGGSNEYPQSMFWSKKKKIDVPPHTPVLLYIKVGFEGVYLSRTCFPDEYK